MNRRRSTRHAQPLIRVVTGEQGGTRRHGAVILLALVLGLISLLWGVVPSHASTPKTASPPTVAPAHVHGRVTNAERRAAAARAAAIRVTPAAKARIRAAALAGVPDYFGTIPNYANSPLPSGPVGSIKMLAVGSGYRAPVTVKITDISWGSGSGAKAKATIVNGHIVSIQILNGGLRYTDPTVTIVAKHGSGAEAIAILNSVKLTGGIRKFRDALPGLGAAGANALGQYIPIAVADTTTFPGSDYYEVALVQYTEKLSRSLPATTLRGYVQLETPANVTHSKHIALKYPDGSPILDATGQQVLAVDSPQYLGPTIVAQSNRAVRVKFTNYLPAGSAGDLFLPVDTTLMGAGAGPQGGAYTQNRATLHLHGGATPWISDGTPYQWTAPGGDATTYKRGVSVQFVPDMWFDPVTHQVVPSGTAGATNDPGPGSLTFYYTNQQSARLMFYHDHAVGLTRLNVYAGEAAPYVLQDQVEKDFTNGTNVSGANPTAAKVIPTTEIPLVIQDKTFVPKATQLAAEDPTWNSAAWGGTGSLWLPHVYMPNQNPSDSEGVNAMGRWDYNSWFYPPQVGQTFGPITNPLAGTTPLEGPQIPGTPEARQVSPTIVPESFMDTPLVNGAAYPYLKVQRKAYRFRILNASDDRTLNLQIYYAASNAPMWTAKGSLSNASAGEVPMVAASVKSGLPAGWPTDGRDGGVPSPKAIGPSMIQIGNEGGFLPAAVVLPNRPVGYEYFRRTITVLNVTGKTLMLGPAERADVIVDFSHVPAGSKLILYNDAPAPVPAFDSRLDYYTNDGDQTSSGGAPSTAAGYGPNTRTIMQFQVAAAPAVPRYNLAALRTALPAIFAADQPAPVVPEPAYDAAYKANFPLSYMHVIDSQLTFTPIGSTTPVTLPQQEKAIIEQFDMDYGRMNAVLGTGLANGGASTGTATPYSYDDTPTDFVLNSAGTQIGTLADGTQIWRVDHQGVDTHSIHFHLFNVEVINRVAIDGQIFAPDPNELGWKETVRMNPGQDVILAVRAIVPTLPWKIGESIRPMEPSVALGAQFMDANGTLVTNALQNYGWEYVWHCHLLGHEENDMMRPIVFQVAPAAPSAVTATVGTFPLVAVAWTDNATTPAATMYTVERATDSGFTQNVVDTAVNNPAATSFNDTTIAHATTYYYRVRAENDPSFSTWVDAAAPAVVP
jgi:FtsP/CotA-like multicopper oxidase with cupredoxin domain